MKVVICGVEYRIEFGTYNAKAPYNNVLGDIGGYIDEIDNKIVIHAWKMSDFKDQRDFFEEIVWYELLCAFAYEYARWDIWNDSDTDANAHQLAIGISKYMASLLEAFYDIKTDLNHYIHTHRKKGGEI